MPSTENSRRNFPWTLTRITSLLMCIQELQPYLASKNESSKKWKELVDNVFEQDEFADLRTTWYIQNDKESISDLVGRFKSQLRTSTEKVSKFIENISKNTSGFEGDRPPYFEIVQNILKDKETANELKKDNELQKEVQGELLTENERVALTLGQKRQQMKDALRGPGKRRLLNGTMTGSSRSTATNSFQSRIFKALDMLEGESIDETKTSFLINEWICSKGLTLDTLLNEAGCIDMATTDILHMLELKFLIGVYCAKGSNFGAAHFLEQMAKMQIHVIVANKVLYVLQEWKRKAEAAAEEENEDEAEDDDVIVTTPSSATSVTPVMTSNLFP